MRTHQGSALLLGLGLMVFLTGNLEAISKQDLFPYGIQLGDERLQVGDDISSSEIQLNVPVVFYESFHNSIFVSIFFLIGNRRFSCMNKGLE